MSSRRQDWRTPKKLFDELDFEFHFDFDPCFVSTGSLHERDMLGSDWGGEVCFVNPPYRFVSEWIKKGIVEWRKGKTIVFLVPARTDTSWFHDYLLPNAEIRFIRGRLKFDDAKGFAPFPSMIAILRKK